MIAATLMVALVACGVGSLLLSRNVRLLEYASFRGQATFRHILYSVLASLVGGWMFFGLCAIGYEAGVVGYVIGAGYAAGLYLFSRAVPRIKRAMLAHDCDTLDDFLGARYGPLAQWAATILNLSFFLAVLAAQFIAMTALLSVLLPVERELVFYTAAATVLAYTVMTGFKGVLLTDVWQFMVVSVAVAAVFVTLTVNADFTAISALPTTYFNATGYGVVFLVGAVLFLPLSLLVRTDLWQRVASAKDPSEVRNAFQVAAPVVLVFYVILTTIGIYARARLGEGEKPDTSGLRLFVLQITDPGTGQFTSAGTALLILFSLGVLAALLSTIDTNLNVVSVAISKLIRRHDWRQFERETTDKISGARTHLERRLIRTARIVTAVLGIAGIAVSRFLPDIVDLIVAAAAIILVLLPAVIAALFFHSGAGMLAANSIIIAYLAFVALALGGMDIKTAFLPGVVVSVLVFCLPSAIKRALGRGRS